jgi:hypothetical protein
MAILCTSFLKASRSRACSSRRRGAPAALGAATALGVATVVGVL